MDQKARILRGHSERFSVKIGGTAMSAGDPFMFSSGLAVAVTDGSAIDGVLVDDGAANEDNVRAEILRDGDVWVFTVSSLTAKRGTKLAAAGSGLLDGGTSGDPSIGIVVDKDVSSSDTTAHVLIRRGTI